MAEQSAIYRSPPAGGKPVCSERERSSQPDFQPAAAPRARRFRLTSQIGRDPGSSLPLNREEKW